MRYLFGFIVLVLTWMFAPTPQVAYAGPQPGSGIDSTRTIGSLTSVELFRWIFQKDAAAVDSLVIYVREHQSDTTVVAAGAVAEILSTATARIISLQEQYLERHKVTPAGVF